MRHKMTGAIVLDGTTRLEWDVSLKARRRTIGSMPVYRGAIVLTVDGTEVVHNTNIDRLTKADALDDARTLAEDIAAVNGGKLEEAER